MQEQARSLREIGPYVMLTKLATIQRPLSVQQVEWALLILPMLDHSSAKRSCRVPARHLRSTADTSGHCSSLRFTGLLVLVVDGRKARRGTDHQSRAIC